MKVSIDVPSALYWQVAVRAAREGRSLSDVTVELFEAWLATTEPEPEPELEREPEPITGNAWLARWRELGRETDRLATDPRSSVEILLTDRR